MAKGGFDDTKEEGTYVCAGCKTPLYTAEMKFDCGCGWPGFYGNIEDAVYEIADADGMRVEVLCNGCSGHLGHVFRNEGFGNPAPDERHCVNSCSVSFIPASAAASEEVKCTYDGPVYLPNGNVYQP
jgi:peptide-methionine (R)-S-oxide reductase